MWSRTSLGSNVKASPSGSIVTSIQKYGAASAGDRMERGGGVELLNVRDSREQEGRGERARVEAARVRPQHGEIVEAHERRLDAGGATKRASARREILKGRVEVEREPASERS